MENRTFDSVISALNNMVAQKQCRKCDEIKSSDYFGKDKKRKDGLASWCKKCRNAVRHNFYIKHKSKEIKQKIKYYIRNRKQILKREKVYKRKNKDSISDRDRKYQKRKKDTIGGHRKYVARYKTKNAVLSGKLKKLPCTFCGSIKSQAHHHNGYTKEHWLDVLWLCEKHHKIVHRKYNYSKLK
jgi:hypothetical protein